MRGRNWQTFVKWAKRTCVVAAAGVAAGALGGFTVAVVQGKVDEDFYLWPLIGAYACLWLAAIPACAAVWALFLHMLGQAARAARGTDED